MATEVSPEVIWACRLRSAYAVGGPGRGEVVLGRMTAEIRRLPDEGEQCVVVAWPLEEDGRKLHAGTALLSAGGRDAGDRAPDLDSAGERASASEPRGSRQRRPQRRRPGQERMAPLASLDLAERMRGERRPLGHSSSPVRSNAASSA